MTSLVYTHTLAIDQLCAVRDGFLAGTEQYCFLQCKYVEIYKENDKLYLRGVMTFRCPCREYDY